MVRKRRKPVAAFATAAVLIGLLVATAVVAWQAWGAIGGSGMSFHGFLALGLGATGTLLLAIGLMALVFFSHRRGYDDRAGHE